MLNDKLVVIAAIFKSASSHYRDCVSKIIERKPEQARHNVIIPNNYINSPTLIKYHYPPIKQNIDILKKNNLTHIIIFRHPIDQLTALYCDLCRFIGKEVDIKGFVNKTTYNAVHNIDNIMISYWGDVERIIDYMIYGGYLNAVLMWMDEWIKNRVENNSMIIRYEDMIYDFEGIFNKTKDFFEIDKELSEKEINIFKEIYLDGPKHKDKDLSYYKYGWTGYIGTWEKYFTEKNYEHYIDVVANYLKHHPDSKILEYYPNLLNPKEEEEREE